MSGDDPTDLVAAVEDAKDGFEYGRGSVETGFEDIESSAIVQLRKGCRLLEAVRALRSANGYHTAVVELSLGVIERSFEFYALAVSNDTIEDFDDHTHAYQRAFDLGVISAALRDDYRSLYSEHRTESYYGDREVSDVEARAMFELAGETHEYLRNRPREHYDCMCR